MINTNDFKTKTIFQPRQNPSVNGYWGIALDVGFSSVKTFSPNQVACFPSYARKLPRGQKFLGEADNRNILYRDENGDVWLVGMYAQNMIHEDDSDSLSEGLFVKNRFSSPMFKVIARVGLALGMLTNQYGGPQGKNLAVQTGLPPKHLEEYAPEIKEVLAGDHEYEIKIGNRNWEKVKYSLPLPNIRVMEQPMGSLIAVSTDKNGNPVPNAKKKNLNGNVMVLDPGFGTTDIFNISERQVTCDTWDDLSMNAVLQDVCNTLHDDPGYKVKMTVPAIQKCLEKGTVRIIDKKLRKAYDKSFATILAESSQRICDGMLAKLDETYKGMWYHDYLIVTGGLGAAWFDQIKEYYKGIETLKVISGMENDNLDGIFSNVRGYYFNLLNTFKNPKVA